MSHIYQNSAFNRYGILYPVVQIVKFFLVLIDKVRKHSKTFTFRGKKYHYFIHSYNTTWLNERTVEVPIVISFIDRKKRILEVGNVLSHYIIVDWDVVDKFEKGNNVTNKDLIDFKPKEKYDLVISISTLEHAGYDDDEKDDKKVLKAIKNLKYNCLKKGGKMIVTLPIGYNKTMDKQLFSNKLLFNKMYFLKKISKDNYWKEVQQDEVIYSIPNVPFQGINAICIAIINN